MFLIWVLIVFKVNLVFLIVLWVWVVKVMLVFRVVFYLVKKWFWIWVFWVRWVFLICFMVSVYFLSVVVRGFLLEEVCCWWRVWELVNEVWVIVWWKVLGWGLVEGGVVRVVWVLVGEVVFDNRVIFLEMVWLRFWKVFLILGG